jgi:ABC-type uncharacterized transport system fused permease/ATPase subunit
VGLLIAIITMDLLLVGINARLNTWNRDFYDALEGRKLREFPQLMLLFSALAFAFVSMKTHTLSLDANHLTMQSDDSPLARGPGMDFAQLRWRTDRCSALDSILTCLRSRT